jgi:hypothetical protein
MRGLTATSKVSFQRASRDYQCCVIATIQSGYQGQASTFRKTIRGAGNEARYSSTFGTWLRAAFRPAMTSFAVATTPNMPSSTVTM